MELSLVNRVHALTNAVHRVVYFVPEAAEEYEKLGIVGRGGYVGSRSAALGAVSNELITALFYNFHPRAIRAAMDGVWSTTTPEAMLDARYRVVARALERFAVPLDDGRRDEALELLTSVVDHLDVADKPMAAAHRAIGRPDDPWLALWQCTTVIREWRGDAHMAVLVTNDIGPCACNVLQVGTGRFPLAMTQASRQWSEQEWQAAIDALAARGWTDGAGALTPLGRTERERIETDTDRICAPLWSPIGEAGVQRVVEALAVVEAAAAAGGAYDVFR